MEKYKPVFLQAARLIFLAAGKRTMERGKAALA